MGDPTLKVLVEGPWEDDTYTVSISRNGTSWRDIGVPFPMWVKARAVAVAIANGVGTRHAPVAVQIIDKTGGDDAA